MEQINGALFTIQNFMNKRSIVHLSQASTTYSKNLNLVASSENSDKKNTRELIASNQKLQLNQTVPTCQRASVGPLPDLQTAHTCLPTSIRSARCSLAHPIGIRLISSDAPTRPTPDSISHRSRVSGVPMFLVKRDDGRQWRLAMQSSSVSGEGAAPQRLERGDSGTTVEGRGDGVEAMGAGRGERRGARFMRHDYCSDSSLHGHCGDCVCDGEEAYLPNQSSRGSRMGAVVPWSTAME